MTLGYVYDIVKHSILQRLKAWSPYDFQQLLGPFRRLNLDKVTNNARNIFRKLSIRIAFPVKSQKVIHRVGPSESKDALVLNVRMKQCNHVEARHIFDADPVD